MDTKTKKHIEVLNREMGMVQTDIKWIKSELKDFREEIKNLKLSQEGTKRWVYVGILVPIVLFIIQYIFGGG